jgi:calcium binding protein 39
MKYVSDRDNLKILMNLLRSKKVRIQIEAFHVFKVFVVNPRKPNEITLILLNNREKLVAYLQKFHKDVDDHQFEEERALVIDTLLGLRNVLRTP